MPANGRDVGVARSDHSRQDEEPSAVRATKKLSMPRIIKDSRSFLSLNGHFLSSHGKGSSNKIASPLPAKPVALEIVAPPRPQNRYGSMKSTRPKISSSFVPRSPNSSPGEIVKKRSALSVDLAETGPEKRAKSPVTKHENSRGKSWTIMKRDKSFMYVPVAWRESVNDRYMGPLEMAIPISDIVNSLWIIIDHAGEISLQLRGSDILRAFICSEKRSLVLEYKGNDAGKVLMHLCLEPLSDDLMTEVEAKFHDLQTYSDGFGLVSLNEDTFILLLEQYGFKHVSELLEKSPIKETGSPKQRRLPNHVAINNEHLASSAFAPSKKSTALLSKSLYANHVEERNSADVRDRRSVDLTSENEEADSSDQSMKDVSSASGTDSGSLNSGVGRRYLRSRPPKASTFAEDVKNFGTADMHHVFQDGKSTDISLADFKRLDDGEYLNDTLINFFLKLMMEKWATQEFASETYIFNTFFFERLMQRDEKGNGGYTNVKKWTSKVDLLKMKNIIIPIHSKMHWFVAVIYNLPALLRPKFRSSSQEVDEVQEPISSISDSPGLRVLRHGAFPVNSTPTRNTRSKVPINVEEEPLIVIFDSLRSNRHTFVYRALKDYIVALVKDKLDIKVDKESIRAKVANVPQQTNHCDCGVYLIHYMERFMLDPEQSITLAISSATELREAASKSFWLVEDMENKREHLRKSIIMLKESDRLKLKDRNPEEGDRVRQPISSGGQTIDNSQSTDGHDSADEDDIVFLNENKRMSGRR